MYNSGITNMPKHVRIRKLSKGTSWKRKEENMKGEQASTDKRLVGADVAD